MAVIKLKLSRKIPIGANAAEARLSVLVTLWISSVEGKSRVRLSVA